MIWIYGADVFLFQFAALILYIYTFTMNIVGTEQYKLPDNEDVGSRRHLAHSLGLFVKKQ